MAATKEQKIKAMKLARDAVARETNTICGNYFLCNQLKLIKDRRPTLASAVDYWLDFISGILGGALCLCIWSAEERYKDAKPEFRRHVPEGHMVQLRLNWANWLIACLEEDIAEGRP